MKDSWEQVRMDKAKDRGMTAAVLKLPYESNPYDRTTQVGLHLAWSDGHLGMRAKLMMDRDNANT